MTKVAEAMAAIKRIPSCRLEEMARTATPKGMMRVKVCIRIKEGYDVQEIADDMQKDYATIYRWIMHIAEYKTDGINDKKIPGRSRRLTPRQEDILYRKISASPRRCGYPGASWSGPMVMDLLKSEFGVSYTLRGVEIIMCRMGLSRTGRRGNAGMRQ